MSTPITPAGWYDDGHGSLRWWDGSQWTEHTAPLAPTEPTIQLDVQPTAELTEPYFSSAPVKVKGSAVWWAVPIALLVAAVLGALLSMLAWKVVDPAPMRPAFDQYQAAVQNQDCEALVASTTEGFREDLVDGPFTCERWLDQAGTVPPENVLLGMQFGPIGFFATSFSVLDPDTAESGIFTYTMVNNDGRWLVAAVEED
ncbi:MAG TPA: DUF2510 domain-containing protein [Aeromicrobium sp.]|nr:DUF2510 domain-containing protein [Aeromicrobium sp.]